MQIPDTNLEGIVARMVDDDWDKLPPGRLERDLYDTFSEADKLYQLELKREQRRKTK